MHKMQYLTGKELDLLRYFYEHKSGHVRRIKAFTKLSEHTLLKYLSSLEKRKILNSRREGNLKIYGINPENALIKIFYSYFDLIELDSLEYKRSKAVKMCIYLVKEAKIPYFILLFGSSAKGNYAIKSDVDIIVVYDIIEKNVGNAIENIKKQIFAETGLKINCIIMQLNEFLKENKQNYALQDAITYGYPVFGNQIYYETKMGSLDKE